MSTENSSDKMTQRKEAGARKIDHEMLDVYQAGREFLDLAKQAVEDLPTGIGHVRKQMLAAASSITLNIAEGTGRSAGNDQKRFYRYADGSARECAAILDVLHAYGAIDESFFDRARTLLVRIISMLNAMIR